MTREIGYHGNGKEPEGFERLTKGDWIRLFITNNQFVSRVINVGKIGLDLEMYLRDLATNIFGIKEAFMSYESIMGFTRVSEEEVKRIIEREPAINQYLGRYIRLEGAIHPLWGKLEEICSEGVFLRPHLHVRVKTDKLSLDSKNKLYVGEQYLKLIRPSSEGELKRYISRMNQEREESKKTESKKE
ncbi:MAG: hypothetical protein Q8R00_01815 [Candidatus Nanoarchaeia archaeon]|nr:hypothetical protein [Candidatus Nanoarchaeia archaeon]